MKYIILFFVSLSLGFFCGQFVNRTDEYSATVLYTHVSHGRILNTPKFQEDALGVAAEVNVTIKGRTADFIQKNNLDRGDFMAAFVPEKNGNYVIHIWCSNRITDVSNLLEQYENLVDTCISRYEFFLKSCEL